MGGPVAVLKSSKGVLSDVGCVAFFHGRLLELWLFPSYRPTESCHVALGRGNEGGLYTEITLKLALDGLLHD